MTAGIVQKFISLTEDPIPKSGNDPERNPDKTPEGGFEKIESISEYQGFLEDWLEEERFYIGSFLKNEEIGSIIQSIDSDQPVESMGRGFVQLLYS